MKSKRGVRIRNNLSPKQTGPTPVFMIQCGWFPWCTMDLSCGVLDRMLAGSDGVGKRVNGARTKLACIESAKEK